MSTIVPFPSRKNRDGNTPTAVEQYRAQIGRTFRFSFPLSADGLNAGNGALVSGLYFNEGTLVDVLGPGAIFRPKKKRRTGDSAPTCILGCSTGTAVFLSSVDGVYYHFGVDLTDNGVKLLPNQE